jgi:predicted enzyme involved in methoxymalonyl-ACP biosynthesis
VMGRKVEHTMVHLAVARAREAGLTSVEARYVQTPKNKPCFEFWQASGFRPTEDGRFVWSTEREYPLPGEIQLERGT